MMCVVVPERHDAQGSKQLRFPGMLDCRLWSPDGRKSGCLAISKAPGIRDSIVRRVKTQVMQLLGLSRSKYGSGVRLEE
jgi:hypothetical protein